MNILPKKRWHVRTKENIARVRKDEAEAAEKEKQEIKRIEKADREARLNLLKAKSKGKLQYSNISKKKETQVVTTSSHINLFTDLEHATTITNKEHDVELKEKKEEYEKKIGYLTYLGQDTNEALKKKNWYDVLPEESRFSRSSLIRDTYDKLVLRDREGKPIIKDLQEGGEVSLKSKKRLDPMNLFLEYTSHSTKKSAEVGRKAESALKKEQKKKNKEHKKEVKEKLIQRLRETRLNREEEEKKRTQLFLSNQYGSAPNSNEVINKDQIKPKYNSQFNPHLARQNYM